MIVIMILKLLCHYDSQHLKYCKIFEHEIIIKLETILLLLKSN